jgi:hypothetical protein
MVCQEKCSICGKKEWTEPSVFNWGKNGEKYVCESCRWKKRIVGVIALSEIKKEILKKPKFQLKNNERRIIQTNGKI